MNPRRFNDNALEWLIALLRAVSIAFGLMLAGAVLWWASWPGWRQLLLMTVLAVFTGATAYFGWWHFGNEEWRPRKGADLCGARNGELVCTVKLYFGLSEHIGLHHDSVRDPGGDRQW